ncbi:serpentine type 7TM GPCR chemoreceptor srbc domain-containing protein [Ditylenchus destructor]|uniref:Serpentine type 7TM GPCR chemoreceptor srbc domain-containing protein n=1 Tax=Ditylenchus destructor TaxID=166010 RepID=A0AAD4MZ55_9BILA|nr:serpentine type 7TM GPCR chemoreceptor srbc domain-containing protein [Ditylenchus destructor]
MSKSVLIYLVVHIFGSLSTIPHHLYFLLWWQPSIPKDGLYNPVTLFWSGIFMSAYVYTAAVPVFFLTLDRCIALKLPVQYHNNEKFGVRKMLPRVTVIVTVMYWVINMAAFFLELPLDMVKVQYCQSLFCTLLKYHGAFQQYMKIGIGLMNFLCTVYFLYAMEALKRILGKDPITAKNRIVMITTASELLFNIAPIIFAQVFITVTGDSAGNIIGQYATLLFTLDAVICSIFYTKIYLRQICSQVADSNQADVMISTIQPVRASVRNSSSSDKSSVPRINLSYI